MKFKGTTLNGDYNLACGPNHFDVYDKNYNRIYCEDDKGFWSKREYNENGEEIYYENSFGSILDNRYQPFEVGDIVKIIDDGIFNGYSINDVGVISESVAGIKGYYIKMYKDNRVQSIPCSTAYKYIEKVGVVK